MVSLWHCPIVGESAFAVAEWANICSSLAASVLTCAVGMFGGKPVEDRSIPVLTLSRI